MSRLTAVDPSAATGKAKELLDAVKAKMGKAPNTIRTMVQSPAVVEAYLGFSSALGGGVLGAPVREQISLLAAQHNGCEYCLSAHTVLGKMAGLNADDIAAARHSEAADPKTAAIPKFAAAVIERRGAVSDEQFLRAKQAGLSEAEIAEIVANVALNVFTNYFNNVARTDIDFPRVSL